jgi:tetratricopeptide (TPR) repeat protein
MTARESLRIFVAMPVKAMGEDAPWGTVKEIRQKLLLPAAVEIGKRVDCDVELVIEDEKKTSGHIPSSMFAEASDADVYIADLTGFSANVFLELGVRWAVKDGVTILIAQDTSNLKFNVAYNRAIEYGPMPTQLENAIADIADYAVAGLTRKDISDSPVRSGGGLVTVTKVYLESLKSELARVQAQQGEDLIRTAEATEDKIQKMELFRQVVSVNPRSLMGHIKLGQLLREAGQYEKSESALKEATRIAPVSAMAWRELGTTQSKRYELSDASESLRTSLDLDPEHSETWRVLGGLRRRLSRGPSGVVEDWQELLKSREAYEHASELEPNNSYNLFNFWLLSLILAIRDNDNTATVEIIDEFEALKLLCQYEVKRAPRNPWMRFDLSGTLAILEQEYDAVAEVETALKVAGELNQLSYIDSAVPPLRDLVQVIQKDNPRKRAASAVIDRMNAAIESVRH